VVLYIVTNVSEEPAASIFKVEKRREVHTAAILNTSVIWNVTPYSPVDHYQNFGATTSSVFRVEE
jgi:hypothetical protein